ncbi:VOC family protein [Glycomyces sp. TRM65418]|uniref:VOC family protein n=1 Tax=Glycomyces sp. TRM65418 TaxID=2867006 RepID=UPI001D162E00|nr:VOC family protein [Glycomyces sp. TRM65418]MCC3764453.1 VOC family protein [Glycomyces sp. TRM65418]
MELPVAGTLHHVELWVPDLNRAVDSFGWLLERLGYARHQEWSAGRSWRLGPTYLVVEQSRAQTGRRHDRCAPGLNHLAFHVGNDTEVERLVDEGKEHGWTLLFADRHPFAGGDNHYAAYLENPDGFEVELVAVSFKLSRNLTGQRLGG